MNQLPRAKTTSRTEDVDAGHPRYRAEHDTADHHRSGPRGPPARRHASPRCHQEWLRPPRRLDPRPSELRQLRRPAQRHRLLRARVLRPRLRTLRNRLRPRIRPQRPLRDRPDRDRRIARSTTGTCRTCTTRPCGRPIARQAAATHDPGDPNADLRTSPVSHGKDRTATPAATVTETTTADGAPANEMDSRVLAARAPGAAR